MIAPELRGPMMLSVIAAVLTILLKTIAWLLTDSAALFSDAMESIINLIAATAAWFSLRYAARPVDADHTYGHEKIEFFASGLEGVLILLAGVGIGGFAIQRLFNPHPLEALGIGSALSAVAALLNLIVARILLRAGTKHQSIVLEADGHHLMSDVYSSLAVLPGLALVWLTGHTEIDSIVAIFVCISILLTGIRLIRRSFDGLMDHALPPGEQEQIRGLIRSVIEPGCDFHALRTRRAGQRRFADFHLLVPGQMSVSAAHELSDRVEIAILAVLERMEITIHIEPIEEERSFEDNRLAAFERKD